VAAGAEQDEQQLTVNGVIVYHQDRAHRTALLFRMHAATLTSSSSRP